MEILRRRKGKGKEMKDIKKLLAIKAELETAMQRDIDPLMRVVIQRRLDKVCEEIEKAYAGWDKLFEPQENDRNL